MPTEPEKQQTARIRWEEIHAYARQVPEYEIVRSIRAEAQAKQVAVDNDDNAGPQQRLRGRPIASFGPVRIGMELNGQWTVAALTRSAGCIRCALSSGEHS